MENLVRIVLDATCVVFALTGLTRALRVWLNEIAGLREDAIRFRRKSR